MGDFLTEEQVKVLKLTRTNITENPMVKFLKKFSCVDKNSKKY